VKLCALAKYQVNFLSSSATHIQRSGYPSVRASNNSPLISNEDQFEPPIHAPIINIPKTTRAAPPQHASILATPPLAQVLMVTTRLIRRQGNSDNRRCRLGAQICDDSRHHCWAGAEDGGHGADGCRSLVRSPFLVKSDALRVPDATNKRRCVRRSFSWGIGTRITCFPSFLQYEPAGHRVGPVHVWPPPTPSWSDNCFASGYGGDPFAAYIDRREFECYPETRRSLSEEGSAPGSALGLPEELGATSISGLWLPPAGSTKVQVT
jgi:hypothetical protein